MCQARQILWIKLGSRGQCRGKDSNLVWLQSSMLFTLCIIHLSTQQRMDEKIFCLSSVLQASASTDFLKISELLFIKTSKQTKRQEVLKKNQWRSQLALQSLISKAWSSHHHLQCLESLTISPCPNESMFFFKVSMSQVNRATRPRSSSYLRSLTKCWRKDKEKPPGETNSIHGIYSLHGWMKQNYFQWNYSYCFKVYSMATISMLGDWQNLVIFFRAQREVYLGALWNTTWRSKPTKHNLEKLYRKNL